MDDCQNVHTYTAEEACHLVTRFGGIQLSGDSLTRHFVNALFIILRNSLGGAMEAEHDPSCYGEGTFNDGKVCRLQVLTDFANSP